MIERYLAALQYRDYRLLWLSSLSAGGAAWALIVARAWLVYDLSDSSLWVGATTFAAMAPLALVPPVAGYLADKLDRKKILAWVFALQFLHNLILAVLAISGSIEIWHIIALSFFNGTIRATQLPAMQALLPNLIPEKDLMNGIALNQATFHGARLVGPALIAPLLLGPGNGAGAAFLLCTVLYALSFVIILRIQTTSRGVIEQGKGTIHEFLAGLGYIYSHPLILPLVIIVVLHCCLTMAFESLLPVLSAQTFGTGAAGVTYLMMSVGAGATISVFLLAGIQTQHMRGRLLFISGLFSGLTPIALALSPTITLALISSAGMGASQAAFMAVTTVFIQSSVPDAIRGRVMSVYLWHIGGMMALVNLINGALADLINVGLILLIPGLVFLIAVPLSLSRPSLRKLYMSGSVT